MQKHAKRKTKTENDKAVCTGEKLVQAVFLLIAAEKQEDPKKFSMNFYKIYSFIFLKIMRTTDLQENTQSYGKDHYDVTITKCLWHTACKENGCEELCHLFCDVDDVTYGGLKKIGFTRTKTLGYGGDCCNFHFFKKQMM